MKVVQLTFNVSQVCTTLSANLNVCFESEHLAHVYTSMFFSTAVSPTLWLLNKTTVFYLVTPCDVHLQLLLMLVVSCFLPLLWRGTYCLRQIRPALNLSDMTKKFAP